MKEASGEASMTGITIALIAIVAVVATPIITNTVNSTKKKFCMSSGWRNLVERCLLCNMYKKHFWNHNKLF